MQLNKPQSIRGALAAATCGVLSGAAHASTPSADAWDVDATFLNYVEKDRVSVYAPAVMATKAIGQDEYLTVTGVFDSLTGSSPTGAAPGVSQGSNVLVVTSPSGSTITTPAGELPQNDFSDTRVSLSVDWDRPLDRLSRNAVNASVSSETDYFSLGVSDTYTQEFNNRQTTLAIGGGLTLDYVAPKAGTPTEMTSFSYGNLFPDTVTSASSGIGGENKNTIDMLVGVTQAVNRRTLVQVNYSHSFTSGYTNDPYKYLSIVDATTGETVDYMYEGRPDSRSIDVLYFKGVYHFPEDVMHASFRLFKDDWGINSTTFDVEYRYELPGGMYLKPSLRLYNQSAADFYRHSLVDGVDTSTVINLVNGVPQGARVSNLDYASSDMRLAEMQSTTYGLKFGMELGEGANKSELSFRIAQMVQTGESSPADAIGVQQNFNMYPDLEATIIQVNYSFTY